MALRTEHWISDLRRSPGELSFQARVGGKTQTVWFRTESAVTPPADAALAACLMPAMRHGGTLTMTEPISPRVMRNQREFQAIQAAWSLAWELGEPPLREVEVSAPLRRSEHMPTGRVGTFFSGGVDSWFTVLEEPGVTDLIFVRGFDLVPGAPHQRDLGEEVERRLRGAAAEVGHSFHVVDTNLRELSDRFIRWESYFAEALVAVALLFEPLFDRVLIAGDIDYEAEVPIGASRLVDQLWSTESLEIVDAAGRFSRQERLQAIVDHPAVQRSLRVCWENPEGAYNCGHCRKCLALMASLEAFGKRELVATLPTDLDLNRFAAVEISQHVQLALWEDVRESVRATNSKPDLEAAVEGLIARGKKRLELPPTYRARRASAPEAGAEGDGRPGMARLFASPETADAVSAAQRLAVLVGGYDGSGNYGDMAQLDAALELLGGSDPSLVLAPVLEGSLAAEHSALAGEMFHPPTHPLYFGRPNEIQGDALVEVAPPSGLAFGACYLYGGGHLNSAWGGRKLAMLGAAEDLMANADSGCRVSSGLQVDAEWLAGLGAHGRHMLRSFDLLGSRDAASADSLATLGAAAPVLDTGDDAVGILRHLSGRPAAAPEAVELAVNLHFAQHTWITAAPAAMAGFFAEFLATLTRLAGRPLSVRPYITYLDGRVSEHRALEQLAAACAEREIELEEPRVLRPVSLHETMAELGKGRLTVCCSYHAALTSLMAAVPALLVTDNAYYEQKAAGLLGCFNLPAVLATTTAADPSVCAAAVGDLVLDPVRAEALRAQLHAGATSAGTRREEAEAQILSRLGSEASPRPFPARPSHEIAELRAVPGELSFVACSDGRRQRLWIRTETEVTPPADAALAACLMPAMSSGGTLSISEPISPRLLRTQREYQAIQRAWSLDWHNGEEPLREVEVIAPTRPTAPRAAGRVGAFFSGGVDSWATVLDNPDVTDLIFVRGLDLIPNRPEHQTLADEVERRLRSAATELELELHVVETNLRELSDPMVNWESYNPSAMAAVALFFEPLFDRLLIASDSDHETQIAIGSGRMVDQLWSTERLEIVDDGGRFNREQRLRRIADHPTVQKTLRVCWENRGGAYNCGRCQKCLLTMVSLEAIGARRRVTSFPEELDLKLFADFKIVKPIALPLWEDLLDTTRVCERPDLERVLEPLIEAGKENLGKPPSYRGRRGDRLAGALAALRASEHRAAAAEHDSAIAHDQLETVLDSRSWRITAPLRHGADRLRRGLRRG